MGLYNLTLKEIKTNSLLKVKDIIDNNKDFIVQLRK